MIRRARDLAHAAKVDGAPADGEGMDPARAERAISSRNPAIPQLEALEAGWAALIAAPVADDRGGDCIVLGDSDLFDVEPLG